MSSTPVRILYVEDDPGAARLFQKKMCRRGYQVDLAHDGEQGLAIWRMGQHDVLAVDQDMPKLCGLDLIRALALQGPLPPTVMVTGAGNEAIAVEAIKLGADDYIIKDYEARYLELIPSVIERALQRRVLLLEKKRADEQLRESEAHFRLLVEKAPEAIFVQTRGAFAYLNTASLRLFGAGSPEELLGASVLDRFHPDFHDVVRERIRLLNEEKKDVPPLQQVYIRMDGSTVDVEVSAVPIHYRGMDGALVVARDITERKRATAFADIRLALMEFAASNSLKDLLQKVLDEVGRLSHSPIGFYHFVEKDGTTLSLQAWSTRTVREFCSAEGRGLHYAIDRAGVWVDCVRERRPVIHNDYMALSHRRGLPEGHAPVIRELVVPVIRSGEMVAILGIGNKTGDYTEKDVETVSYFADVVWEIIERKRAEERLASQREMLSSMFESAPYVLMLVNGDGRVENINRKGTIFAGRAKEDLVGLPGGEVFRCVNSFDALGCGRNPVCEGCPVRTRVDHTFQTGRSIYEEEARLTI
ncbi:MAG: PAS domain S-box protein, partial [Pseudomonadota bacterium]